MMTFGRCAAVLTAVIVAQHVSPLAAQAVEPAASRSPDALAALVSERFIAGTSAELGRVLPDSAAAAVVDNAVRQHAARQMVQQRVLWRSGDRAVLFLGGVAKADSAASGTRRPRGPMQFAGLYAAAQNRGGWRVVRSLPIDTMEAITAHTIHAAVLPGVRVDVVDSLSISAAAPYGFSVRLHAQASISSVTLDGRPVAYAFAPAPLAGILWLDVPPRSAATLVLTYSIAEARRAAPPAGARDTTPPASGQYFNTDGWHPYLDLNSRNDRARYAVTATIPRAYHLTTSLPQTDTIVGDLRIVRGVSAHPQFLISILYDRAWTPRSVRIGDLRVETFLRPDAAMSHDTAAAGFARVYRTFNARFGPPNDPPYLAVVQAMAYPQNGCAQRQADLVMCGAGVTDSMTHITRDNPSYTWAHETSHAWTMNADGPAATMLREGWATYAEATAIGAEDRELETAFWERARNGVMLGTEGRQSLIPPGATGGFYSKGGWVFHMLNNILGDSAFDRAMRAFSRAEFDAKPSGYPELIAVMSKEAGYDLTAFTMPWLSSRFMPDLDGQVAGSKLVVTQRQPDGVYDLPTLGVDLVTARGVVRRAIRVSHVVDTVDIGEIGVVTGVRFDPEHRFLMQRRWGEVVRFELPASVVPSAKSVTLGASGGQASFSIVPIPAAREGDVWTVTLPLTEGRYPWRWIADGTPVAARAGEPTVSGVRVVQPRERIGPYPR